jgi:uncharacterized repeat protein (TIGR02543 family)
MKIRVKALGMLFLFLMLFALFSCEKEKIEEEETVEYTVMFNPMGGTEVASVNVEQGQTIRIPQVSREGYTLEGWYTSLNEGVTLDERWSFTNNTVSNDITLYAKWNPNQYTITFENAEGSNLTPITQEFNSFISVTPEKEGHRFVGWHPEIPNRMPAENITVTAIWVVNQYTVSFQSNGGSLVNPVTQDYATEVAAPENPTKTGYSFVGWFTNEELTTPYSFSTMPAENIVLFAKWDINQYTVTFDTDGGSDIMSITQDYNTIISIDDPEKEGYAFAHWSPEIPDRMPAGNMTVTAIWGYTVTFSTDSESVIEPTVVYQGGLLDLPETPQKQGHTFQGWYLDEAYDARFGPEMTINQNMSLYAKWVINTYSVQLETFGGTHYEDRTVDFGSIMGNVVFGNRLSAFGIAHSHYIYEVQLEVDEDGYVTWMQFEGYYLPYSAAQVVFPTGPVDPNNPDGEQHSFPNDVVSITRDFRGIIETVYYAEYFRVGALLFRINVFGEEPYQYYTYSTNEIDDIEVWAEIDSNARYYVEQVLAGNVYIADGYGNPLDLQLANAYAAIGWKKSETDWWPSSSGRGLGWEANMNAIVDLFVGTKMDGYVGDIGYRDGFYTYGDILTGATLSDFAEYCALAQQAYNNKGLPTPQRAGYIFDGWYYDEHYLMKAYNLDTVSNDVTLYAKWIPANDPLSSRALELQYLSVVFGFMTIPLILIKRKFDSPYSS